MKRSIKSIAVKGLKIVAITVTGLLLVLFLVPMIFPGTVAEEIKAFTNKKLEGEVNFSKARLSFFNHFPTLTLTLYDFSLKGSEPYKKDTLLAAKQVGFGVNLKRLLFNNEIKINKIYVANAFVNVKVNEKGLANYNVYISDEPADTTSSTAIRLERIDIKNSHIKYSDLSLKVLVEAKGFRYVGNGDLSESVFDLHTRTQIDSLDFYYEGEPYLKNKLIKADLITNINTNSLAFVFQKNNLKINDLPVMFNGKLNFLKDGYDIDISVSSANSKLEDFFKALPPNYVTWLEQTKLQGETSLLFTFKGSYNASKNIKPDLTFDMSVRNGFVQHGAAPLPVSDIYLDLKTRMPATNVDSLSVKIDSLFLNLGKDSFNAVVETKGIASPFIKAKMKGNLDLAALDKAFGIPNVDLQGTLKADVKMNGVYNAEKRLFPVTDAKIDLQKGWIKTEYYPNPITDINVIANVTNTSGKYADLKMSVAPASFLFENNPVHVTASLINFDDIDYDVQAKGEIEIAKIYKVFSRKGLELNGHIKADLSLKGKQSYAAKGQYSKLNNKGTLALSDIKTTSEYFPKPFIIKEGLFSFNQDKMWFKKFKAVYGQSDFVLNGYLQNVINFVFAEKATLKGSFDMNSSFINVDEFMFSESGDNKKSAEEVKTENPAASGVILIPSGLNLQLSAGAAKVAYDGLDIQNFKGSLVINQGKMLLNNTRFNLIGCTVNMDASYKDHGPTKADFDFHLQAKDFDIKKAYNEIAIFREMATAAEKAEGIISVDYKLKGVLDGNMKPIYSSLEGGGVLSVSKVKFRGLKMFNVISEKTGSEGIDDPDISKVDIKTAIMNNVITIDRFKMKVAGFRPRIEGETNLDGQLSLKMRLGLPPLGILGIPIVIEGTQENPKVKIFSKTSEEVDETEYIDSTGVVKPVVPKDLPAVSVTDSVQSAIKPVELKDLRSEPTVDSIQSAVEPVVPQDLPETPVNDSIQSVVKPRLTKEEIENP